MDTSIIILLSVGMSITAGAIGYAASQLQRVLEAVESMPKRELLSAQLVQLDHHVQDVTALMRTIDQRLLSVDAEPVTPRGALGPGLYMPNMAGDGPIGSLIPINSHTPRGSVGGHDLNNPAS